MTNLKDYGYESTPHPPGLIPGRVTELQRDRYTVITQHGEVAAALKGTFYHSAQVRDELPCVGDFVLLQYNDTGVSMIAELLPRRTKFSRADFFGHSGGHIKTNYEQVVAVNFDYVFIVTSLNLDFNVNRIVRYLTQAWQSGGEPVIILTKADLCCEQATSSESNPNLPVCGNRQSHGRVGDHNAIIEQVNLAVPGVPVHAVSSHTGQGMAALAEYLQPRKTVVFLGMSGVGKSSLLNALMQQDVMAVSAIREVDSRGRHTTTHRQLFMLPGGAMVIDTPGMRELGLYNAEEGISAVFSDVEELFVRCKFSDCKHETEPGCAVIAALAEGSLPREQWDRYVTQKRESKYMDDKTAYMQEVRARGKAAAKYHKH